MGMDGAQEAWLCYLAVMARILPTDYRNPNATGAIEREIDTLSRLEHVLPDDFTVFHGVHWSRPDRGLTRLGAVNFVILAPSGRLLLVEQRTGFLEEGPEGLVKRQFGTVRRIRVGVDRTLADLERRLEPVRKGEALVIDYLLHCPDYRVRELASAGLEPRRIVDSTRRDQLTTAVREALGNDPPRPELARRLHRFFANEFELVPDASALVGRAADLFTRLSEGLATWARRIELQPHRIRVVATAGSGKTQLALALLADASNAGRKALYLCFNRPLADHIGALAHAPAHTYHQWCAQRLRARGEAVDFAAPDVYRRLAERSAALPLQAYEQVDCLIVDEGQDFEEGWRNDVLRAVHAEGQAWWLEDPLQNLYGRDVATLPGWATLRTDVNYRSPRTVVAELNRLLAPDHRFEGAGPIAGNAVQWLSYADAAGMVAQTKAAITHALRSGFRREDIAIVTFSGRQRSHLLAHPTLGPHRLRAFTGRYDLFGNPEFAEGELLIDTVYRFKGQSSPCVILAEVDFGEFDDAARRKLFVGMTRASMHLIVVISERSAARLAALA